MLVRVVAVGLGVLFFFGTAVLVFAAGEKQVGEYTVAVRWEQDPPVAGFLNAIVVDVTRGPQRIAGLQETLTAEVRTQGAGGRSLQLRPGPTAGTYRAPLIPTDARSYEIRLGGTIAGTPVDVSFSKADGLTEPLQASTVAYPNESLPEKAAFFESQLVGLNGKAVASQQDAEDARVISTQARTITVGAAVMAVMAMTVGAVAFGMARRRLQPSTDRRR